MFGTQPTNTTPAKKQEDVSYSQGKNNHRNRTRDDRENGNTRKGL